MKPFTVNELKRMCAIEIARGNGDKKIIISSDDEGNEYHDLFFGFTNMSDDFRDSVSKIYYGDTNLSDAIILG